MKSLLMTMALAVGVVFSVVPADADAKRFGGARSSGMQRNLPDKPPPNAPANPAATPQNAAPPAAAAAPVAGAAAVAPKRSWMGPVAGLAAGLGLAALFSHLGLGAELANFVMLALLALAAFVVVRMLLLRRGAAVQPALQGAGAGALAPARPQFVDERPGMQRAAPTASAAPTLPEGFDGEGFERLARMLFIRMQAANDSADLDDLRNFTTPELYAALRLDLQDRGDAPQRTDVVKVSAQLIDYAQESDQQVVSVRYTGLLREEDAGVAEALPFDEVWHLVRPLDDSRNWAIAGIQQRT
jgi:predicted lipid-binding transport protein (Tim44 family)